MQRLADMADRNMVGWHYWTYSNIFGGNDFPGTSLIEDLDLPPTADNIKQPAIDALARPYPQVVAGTPKSWSMGGRQLQPDLLDDRADREALLPRRR